LKNWSNHGQLHVQLEQVDGSLCICAWQPSLNEKMSILLAMTVEMERRTKDSNLEKENFSSWMG